MANSNESKSVVKDLSPETCSSPGQGEKSVSDCLAEATEYVDSIMSSQMISRVDTPNATSRKRNLSVSGTSDTSPKKARGDDSGDCIELEDLTDTNRSHLKARRSLSKNAKQNAVVTEADVHVSATPTVQQLFAKLSSDMNMMFMSVNERLDKIDAGLEQRIATKVGQVLDKRVNSEMNKIKKDFDSRLEDFRQSLRAEVAADLDDIRDELNSREPSTQNVQQVRDISLNIVIRNLPESHNENTKTRVNSLFRDGLRLSDVTVEEADRKQSHSDSKPGVIIARMKNKQEKQRVMKEKSRLKDSRQFAKVFIHHDQHTSERSVSNNFRRIVRAMKSNSSNLSMRGARIIYDRDSQTSYSAGASYSEQLRDSGTKRDYERQYDRSDRRDGDCPYSVNRRDYDYNRGGNRNDFSRGIRQDRPRNGYRWRD